jgi:hypothetical protein
MQRMHEGINHMYSPRSSLILAYIWCIISLKEMLNSAGVNIKTMGVAIDLSQCPDISFHLTHLNSRASFLDMQ